MLCFIFINIFILSLSIFFIFLLVFLVFTSIQYFNYLCLVFFEKKALIREIRIVFILRIYHFVILYFRQYFLNFYLFFLHFLICILNLYSYFFSSVFRWFSTVWIVWLGLKSPTLVQPVPGIFWNYKKY